MTRPVPGPTSPESRGPGRDSISPDSKKFQDAMKKVEGVEKVSETEFEKQQKKPYYTQEEEEEEEQDLGGASGFDHLNPLPSPSQTPVSQAISEPPTGRTPSKDLPHSFNEDELPDTPIKPAQLSEKHGAFKKKKETKEPDSEKHKKKELLVAGFEGKKEEKKKKETSATPPWQMPLHQEGTPSKGKAAKKEIQKEAKTQPPSPLWTEEKKEKGTKPQAAPLFEESAAPQKKEERPKEVRRTIWEPQEKEKEEEKKESKKREVKMEGSLSLIPDPLPPQAQAVAASAQISAAPYLSPETAALFSKLVGTIFFMGATTPGITRTEVVLNADAFRNSPLYNSKIILEKYATAPDAYNIRLIGTPEAAKTFDQNSANLIAAFTAAYEERRIQFRVGRLDISLDTDKPLFRRKEAVGRDEESLQ